jgi:hypothetical protein
VGKGVGDALDAVTGGIPFGRDLTPVTPMSAGELADLAGQPDLRLRPLDPSRLVEYLGGLGWQLPGKPTEYECWLYSPLIRAEVRDLCPTAYEPAAAFVLLQGQVVAAAPDMPLRKICHHLGLDFGEVMKAYVRNYEALHPLLDLGPIEPRTSTEAEIEARPATREAVEGRTPTPREGNEGGAP